MSLLTICQNTVDALAFGARPAYIVGNNDALARQMLAVLNMAIPRLAGRHNWQALVKLHSVTTANGTESYALPSDLGHYITETFWDATNYWPMAGSMDPQTWQTLKRGLVASSIRKRFRVYANLLYIYPTPTATESLVAEYISSKPVLDNDGSTYKTTFTEDADTFVLPEALLELDLKWRLLKAKGLDYAEEFNEFERAVERAIAQDTPAKTVNLGMETARSTPSYLANIPQTITGV